MVEASAPTGKESDPLNRIIDDRMATLPCRVPRVLPPEVLTRAEVARLIDACGSDDATSVRNRALIAVLYRVGLRIGEARMLLPKDVDIQAGTVRVLRAKGGRSRTCGMDAGAGALVKEWLAVRGEWVRPAQGVLDLERVPAFCTRPGAALSAGYLRRLLPALARAAGIAKRVHAHGLRHTHAAELREEGVDIGIISKQLGHRGILTTIRYLDHIAPVAVVEAVRQRVWS